MNDEITKATSDHKRRQWREFVESIDHRTNSTKLWRTIKGIDGKSKQTAENEGITFTGRSRTSPKLIANSFNRQFTTSKLGKHSSSSRTRHVSKDVKRMSLEQAESFTSDQVTSAIKSCRSSRAYVPDTLSIFQLKNLGSLATEHFTALYNDSLKSCRLPSIWKTSLVIPIPKPDKDSSQGTSYIPMSLLCPAAKVLEALILPYINKFLSPAKDQHGFGDRHSTTSALLQLTTDIETCFNQRKPPHRTVCVAIDPTAAFDTVSHDTLISAHTCGRFSYSTPRKQQSTEEASPPPISDEEQRLNRRQRCTLSQLRSGHCHLFQDYKYRVFGEPSDICTDCGASPQDVRHLFACNTHPTDLSPENLWRNPVRSIRAFSYLDNGNLD